MPIKHDITPDNIEQPFQVGDLVVTDFRPSKKGVVRRITSVRRILTKRRGGQWIAAATGGEPCPLCRQTPDKPLKEIDAPWYELYVPLETEKLPSTTTHEHKSAYEATLVFNDLVSKELNGEIKLVSFSYQNQQIVVRFFPGEKNE